MVITNCVLLIGQQPGPIGPTTNQGSIPTSASAVIPMPAVPPLPSGKPQPRETHFPSPHQASSGVVSSGVDNTGPAYLLFSPNQDPNQQLPTQQPLGTDLKLRPQQQSYQ